MFQAFSSLGNQWRYIRDLGDAPNPVLNHPLLTRIAAAHKRSVAQVVLRWQQQLGVAIIPASRNHTHQSELISMISPDFDLSAEEMTQIESLDGYEPGNQTSEETVMPVRFQSRAESRAVVSWVNHATGDETKVGLLEPGGVLSLSSYVGHRFVARGENWQQTLVVTEDTEVMIVSDSHSHGEL